MINSTEKKETKNEVVSSTKFRITFIVGVFILVTAFQNCSQNKLRTTDTMRTNHLSSEK
ncbi:MAG: hypothetical protein HUU56_00695 [Bdellovibrionaceae bacterium]|nr:hypothetical protein [Pseudobdellovibrionaceae bacterium]